MSKRSSCFVPAAARGSGCCSLRPILKAAWAPSAPAIRPRQQSAVARGIQARSLTEIACDYRRKTEALSRQSEREDIVAADIRRADTPIDKLSFSMWNSV